MCGCFSWRSGAVLGSWGVGTRVCGDGGECASPGCSGLRWFWIFGDLGLEVASFVSAEVRLDVFCALGKGAVPLIGKFVDYFDFFRPAFCCNSLLRMARMILIAWPP